MPPDSYSPGCFDLNGSFGITKQASVYVDVPYLHSGWSIPLPIGAVGGPAPGPRYQQNAALGLGVKFPTGKDNDTSGFPDITGGNLRSRTVDQSIQPGYGFPATLEAFATAQKVNFFVTGNYLISPRDTNGVPSIIATLGVKPNPAAPSTIVNSVPDQYLVRIGVGTVVPGLKGVSASVAYRQEGVPAKDLIGHNHGVRRPGYSTSVEPSLSYTQLNTTYTLSLPQTLTRNRVPTVSDGVEVRGDATFADSQFIVNITHRFGM